MMKIRIAHALQRPQAKFGVVLGAVFLAELTLMLVADQLQLVTTGWAGALIDAATLTAVASIIMWPLIIKPLHAALAGHIEKLFRLARDAILLIDPSGNVVEANDAAVAAYGYSLDELRGMNIRDLRTVEAQAAIDRDWQGASGPLGVLFETVNRRKDGSTFPVEVSAQTIDIEGKPYRQSFTRDITARKRTEERLQKLSHAVEQSPAATAITDTHGRFDYVNPKFLEVTGYTQEELIGKTPAVIKSGLTLPDVYEDLWRTILSGREWRGEMQNRRKNGELYWEYEIISPLKNEHGEIVNFIAIKEDITERKRAEERMQARDAYLTAIIENQPGLIWLKDVNGRFLAINRAFAVSCGRETQDVLGKTDLDIWPREMAEKYIADDGKLLQEGRPIVVEEMIDDKNGPKWFETFKTAIRDSHGNIIGSTGYARDITERKEAEGALQQEHARLLKSQQELFDAHESLAEADRLESVGRLAAGVAHEVKNPLTIIRLGTDYLAKQFPQESNQEVVDDIRAAIDRAEHVIRDLLDFSRQNPFAPRPTNINEVLDNAINLIKHEIERRNIVIIRNRDDPMPPIYADPDRLVQVFINLLSNAAQAIGGDGRIEIVTRSICLSKRDLERAERSVFRIGEPVVTIDIRDSGPGVSAEHENKLFEPFFTTKPVGEGTGLGLAVSRSIVILHRGSISISNRPEGGASALLMFRVYREHLTNEKANTGSR